ncbi:MAG: methylated-DNA--[protein]-cysteine S-methyltransferase [Actinomycetota bacterium]
MAARVSAALVTAATPIGAFTAVVTDRGVAATWFHGDDISTAGTHAEAALAEAEAMLGQRVNPAPRGLASVRREVEGYFAGTCRTFETPVDLALGPGGFGRRVLAITASIPYGELWTYGDVAQMAGSSRGGRAAGNALNRCRIELFVPCHRVVHAGGTIGGYGRHTDRKRFLIALERGAVDHAGDPTRGRSPRRAR